MEILAWGTWRCGCCKCRAMGMVHVVQVMCLAQLALEMSVVVHGMRGVCKMFMCLARGGG